MTRLSLRLQLALILTLAMITSLLVLVVVDRVNDIYRTKNTYLGSTDALAVTLVELHRDLSPSAFEIALELARHPSNWLHYGAWEGLHPQDIRDTHWEEALLTHRAFRDLPVRAIRVASRDFDYAPTRPRPPGPPTVRREPNALSIGDFPRPMLHRPPPDGSP